MTSITESHAQLIAALSKSIPPRLTTYTPPDVFEHDVAEYLDEIHAAVADHMLALAAELKDHGLRFDDRSCAYPMDDCIETIKGACIEHAHELREDMLERAR